MFSHIQKKGDIYEKFIHRQNKVRNKMSDRIHLKCKLMSQCYILLNLIAKFK